jgi:hypothetical protein
VYHINHEALRRADSPALQRWAANLAAALETPRPHDETRERWECERQWVADLYAAIREVLDEGRDTSIREQAYSAGLALACRDDQPQW